MVLSVSKTDRNSPIPNPLEASSPETQDTSDTEYLTLRIDSMCTDVAISTYGVAVQLGLRGIRIIDKFHVGEYTTQNFLFHSFLIFFYVSSSQTSLKAILGKGL